MGGCDDDDLSGAAIAGLAVRPVEDGTARTVPTGAVAGRLVALDGDRLIAVDGPPGAPLANHGCLPLAHREVGAAPVLAQGPEAVAAFGRAHARPRESGRV